MDFKSNIKKLLGLKQSDLISFIPIKRRWQLKYGKYFYKKKYTTDSVIEALKKLGIDRGSNLFIHSSWDFFNNYLGSEDELIDAIIDMIGPEGTLAMPAMPLLRKNKIFNVRKSVTNAGFLAEAFRKHEGVLRSRNVKHSVCAYGPLAEELTATHHESLIRFDEKSPFFKTIQYDFKIVSMGLEPYFIGTIIHCVEATMWQEMSYFADIYDFDHLVEQHYIDYDGEERVYYEAKELKHVRGDHYRNNYLLWRYFDKRHRGKTRVSNLVITYVDAKYTYERLCELARKGIVLYIIPKFHR